MEKVINITKEKYMDTDIDTLLISFSSTSAESFVNEYPVPEEMPYILMYSKEKDTDALLWIEIINPKGMTETKEAYIPEDIGTLEYEGKEYTLLELIKALI